MRILFLIYHGFSEHSGISKKIHYQVKGLRENGHDVRLCYYDFAANGHRCRYIDGKVLKDYGSKYQLQDKVIFHGTLFGKELDDVFNQCQFAIGSLGRHRSGITVIKTLKNREYATRGIPFIYSEQDSDFDHQPYVVKAPADETPIDIEQIVHFMEHFTMSPEEFRATVGQLIWSIQMQHVVDGVFNS